MNFSKSDIVTSIAGRDKGNYFFVVDTDGEYVLIADGKCRKLETPKRKKQKHLILAARAESGVMNSFEIHDNVLNSELRRELAVFRRMIDCQNQGG